MEAVAVALSSEGPECVGAAINHLLIDQVYNDPYSKIIMEMFRLANKTPPEGASPPSRGKGCWVRRT